MSKKMRAKSQALCTLLYFDFHLRDDDDDDDGNLIETIQ